jgi:hypothetical protein
LANASSASRKDSAAAAEQTELSKTAISSNSNASAASNRLNCEDAVCPSILNSTDSVAAMSNATPGKRPESDKNTSGSGEGGREEPKPVRASVLSSHDGENVAWLSESGRVFTKVSMVYPAYDLYCFLFYCDDISSYLKVY